MPVPALFGANRVPTCEEYQTGAPCATSVRSFSNLAGGRKAQATMLPLTASMARSNKQVRGFLPPQHTTSSYSDLEQILKFRGIIAVDGNDVLICPSWEDIDLVPRQV
jgi:hypothetical protein